MLSQWCGLVLIFLEGGEEKRNMIQVTVMDRGDIFVITRFHKYSQFLYRKQDRRRSLQAPLHLLQGGSPVSLAQGLSVF